MSGATYMPVQIFSGEKGPAYPFFTLAAFWVATRSDSAAWKIEHVGPPHAAPAVSVFSPAFAHFGTS